MDMPTIAKEQSLPAIAQLIVFKQYLDKSEALEYQRIAVETKQRFLQYLVNNHIFSAANLARIIAKHFGLPLMDLECIDFNSLATNLIDNKLIGEHKVLPVFIRTRYLYLATDDPTQENSFKEIQFHTGLAIKLIVVETNMLHRLIDKIINKNENQHLMAYQSPSIEPKAGLESHISASKEEDAPVVKFVNQIIMEAVQKGVSDIHFEPYKNDYRIRYRQDGLLIETTKPPIGLSHRISARIKVMSNLDIVERRIAQDGRFQMKLSPAHSVDFRVSTCPTVDGEKVVIRILDTDLTQLNIEALGLNTLQKNYFLTALEKPQGLILVTGPTGSGKTISLYTALSILNTTERNISSAEDPVEIKIPGINQVNISTKLGLTFSNILRAFLRQDPDIIMVGEIRDLETAEIAINASQTGHLVLSTLHTNSAAETLSRLRSLGIPAYNLASSVRLLVAQRLARCLCKCCKVLRAKPAHSCLIKLGFYEKEIESLQLYEATGCNQCTNGYRGRVGLFEVMPISKEVAQLIMENQSSLDILKQAQMEGMITLYQSGLEKVKQGITTIEEIIRVCIN